MSDRVAFSCDGTRVEVDVAPGETLLSVLRERLGVVTAKDGCAPQGQCGCCTVLVDGEPRVSCVTPAARVAGRSVTTLGGLDPDRRDPLVDALVATGGAQCGFCTPGIVVRCAALLDKGKGTRAEIERSLAAHLCRCTGWHSIVDAVERVARGPARDEVTHGRDLDAAGRRATIEGEVHQSVGVGVPMGAAGFADDRASRQSLVAVPLPPDAAGDVAAIEAAGHRWVVADSLMEARARAGAAPGRRSGLTSSAPLTPADLPAGGVRVVTSWVEPAYLEPDASWCDPGGVPATPLANGGAFGAKLDSPVAGAARELADRLGRPVRVLWSRDDVVRLGPKRPPISASAVLDGAVVRIEGRVVGDPTPFRSPLVSPYAIEERGRWERLDAPGPPTSVALRAVGLAERTLLIEGALDQAGVDRRQLVVDERARGVLLDSCVVGGHGAVAGARVHLDPELATLERVEVRLAAGDPLDEVVLRSYCLGAAHMALGWVLSERLAVDPESGAVLDFTIRSFGVLRARSTPPIDVVILPEDGPPLAGSDAVFAAVAAATWNAVTRAEGTRPERLPALETRAARPLQR